LGKGVGAELRKIVKKIPLPKTVTGTVLVAPVKKPGETDHVKGSETFAYIPVLPAIAIILVLLEHIDAIELAIGVIAAPVKLVPLSSSKPTALYNAGNRL
jgi:hypothetical protein